MRIAGSVAHVLRDHVLLEYEARRSGTGAIYPWIYSTVGNQTAVGPARRIGQLAAAEFRDAGVAVALQVSG